MRPEQDEGIDAVVPFTRLDLGNRGAVDADIIGKGLLGQSFFLPEFPDKHANLLAAIDQSLFIYIPFHNCLLKKWREGSTPRLKYTLRLIALLCKVPRANA